MMDSDQAMFGDLSSVDRTPDEIDQLAQISQDVNQEIPANLKEAIAANEQFMANPQEQVLNEHGMLIINETPKSQ